MDCAKTGTLIASLRREKGLTQRNIADALGISNKTVSKWECGLGCPDLSLWPDLSAILGVDMAQMMEGEITPNRPDAGNMARLKFYMCPSCGTILTGTGSASIFCCGRKLDPLAPQPDSEAPEIRVEEMDMDYYITFDHPMTKEHYVSFAAFILSDSVILRRLYPEQSPAVRFPRMGRGKLLLCCNRDGLFAYPRLK